jgi:hypothetical protein
MPKNSRVAALHDAIPDDCPSCGQKIERYFASRSDGLRVPNNAEELLVASTYDAPEHPRV